LYIIAKKIIGEIIPKIEKEYKEFAEKNEEISKPDFYEDKWKRLLNQETLRIFFSKNVLFIEGMSDYILFNNILREELHKELKDIETIPIFGKWHYVFFNELAKRLNLNYWFLLDDDRKLDEKGNPKKEDSKHEQFWKKYGEKRTEREKNGVLHSFRLNINIKEIINSSTEAKAKQNAIEQITNFLESNELENTYFPKEYQNWEERITKLNSQEKIAEFMQSIEKETNIRISWFRSDVETFLFGKSIESNKEYYMISRSPEAVKELKKNNLTKLNELKKVLEFINQKIK